MSRSDGDVKTDVLPRKLTQIAAIPSHLGRPPTGRMSGHRRNLIEADKGIFDRLLSTAAASMFDDDCIDDISTIPKIKSSEIKNIFVSNAEKSCISKCSRKVTFSDNLIQGSTRGYSQAPSEGNLLSGMPAVHLKSDGKAPKASFQGRIRGANAAERPVIDDGVFTTFYTEDMSHLSSTDNHCIYSNNLKTNSTFRSGDLYGSLQKFSFPSDENIPYRTNSKIEILDRQRSTVKATPRKTSPSNSYLVAAETATPLCDDAESDLDDEFMKFTLFLRQAHKRRASQKIQVLGVCVLRHVEDVKSDYHDSIESDDLERKVMCKVSDHLTTLLNFHIAGNIHSVILFHNLHYL